MKFEKLKMEKLIQNLFVKVSHDLYPNCRYGYIFIWRARTDLDDTPTRFLVPPHLSRGATLPMPDLGPNIFNKQALAFTIQILETNIEDLISKLLYTYLLIITIFDYSNFDPR